MGKMQNVEYNKGDDKMRFALMVENYGPFCKRQSYKICKEGLDWTLLQSRGSNVYVPKDFVDPDPSSYLLRNEVRKEREYEEELDEDFIFQY